MVIALSFDAFTPFNFAERPGNWKRFQNDQNRNLCVGAFEGIELLSIKCAILAFSIRVERIRLHEKRMLNSCFKKSFCSVVGENAGNRSESEPMACLTKF